jgi:hypothetical protein
MIACLIPHCAPLPAVACTPAQVMEKGGYDRVSAANGWATMAQHMQRDAAFGPLVAAVYACYLHPLEQDLPYGFRAAKAQVRG